MPGIDQSLAIVALVLAVLMALLLSIVLRFASRTRKALQQQVQSQAMLQADLRALCNAAVQVGERVNRMERGLKALQQRQQELGVRQEQLALGDSPEPGFEQAIRLARKGSSVEELMEICNLSRGEAELISMMHRLDPSP